MWTKTRMKEVPLPGWFQAGRGTFLLAEVAGAEFLSSYGALKLGKSRYLDKNSPEGCSRLQAYSVAPGALSATILNIAPVGSASVARRPKDESSGPSMTVAPRPTALSIEASASSTAK